MIKLKNILIEIILEAGQKLGYVKLQLDLSTLAKFQERIDKNDLDTKGLETDPHITLLYGLQPEVTEQQVKEKLKPINFSSVSLFNVSIFEGPADVLKFDVEESGGVYEANKALCELPYTSDFPDYHPHVTIAFIKKGLGKKYVDMFKNEKLNTPSKGVIYKNAGGQKFTIK